MAYEYVIYSILYSNAVYWFCTLRVFGYFHIYVTSILHNKKIKNIYETSVNKPFVTRKLVFKAADSSSAARAKDAQHISVCSSDRVYFSTELNEIFLLVLVASR